MTAGKLAHLVEPLRLRPPITDTMGWRQHRGERSLCQQAAVRITGANSERSPNAAGLGLALSSVTNLPLIQGL